MYNLEQLRMFVETVETGSFSACARKLGKVQSAISQGIANLELDLNIQLFDRSTRKPGLTPEGQHLLGYAKAILHQTAEFSDAVRATELQQESKLRLAIDPALILPELFELLSEFDQHFPATSLELINLSSQEVMVYVAKRQADLGMMLTDLSFPREVELGFIGSINYYAVCSPRHPLQQLSRVTPSALIPHKQLLYRGNDDTAPGVIPGISASIWQSNDLQIIKRLVRQGLGWAYLPSHIVTEDIRNQLLHPLPMSFDHKPWSQPIDLISIKNKPMGPAQSWLYNNLKRLLG